MTGSRARRDPDLEVPVLPAPVPSLRVDDPELALAGEASGGDLLLEGERGAVLMPERGGLEAVHLEGHPVAADVALDAGPVVNRLVSPATLRRERVREGASVDEIVLVPPRLALVAVQLGSAGGTPDVDGRITLLPWAGPLRWNADGSRLVAVARDAPELRVVVALSPDGGAVEPEADGEGGLRLRFRLTAGQHPTLLLAAGSRAGMNPLAPAAHLPGHARMATAAPRGGLELHTGVRPVDDGVAWARTRLATAARRAPRRQGAPLPSALFWSGLGALAAGDEEAAGRYLEALEARVVSGEGTGGPKGGRGEEGVEGAARHPPLPSAPLPVLLAARHALTAGDAGPALRQAARVDAGAADAPAGPEEGFLWSLALTSLADALRWTVGEAAADRYRELGEERGREARLHPVQAPGGRAGGGVRLPMAGEAEPSPPRGTAASILPALLTSPDGKEPPPGPAPPPALAPWVAFREGRVVEAWTLWRQGLGRGTDGTGPGPGRWDTWHPAPQAPETGLALAGLVHGLLGWFPDAPVGRAVLAPRFPGHLTRFDVRGLRVGSATLTLRYEREGAVRRYRITPTGGRAPVTLVLEPRVNLTKLTATRLDGEPVELDPKPGPGNLLVVPLQVPLDGRRVLELEGETQEAGRS